MHSGLAEQLHSSFFGMDFAVARKCQPSHLKLTQLPRALAWRLGGFV